MSCPEIKQELNLCLYEIRRRKIQVARRLMYKLTKSGLVSNSLIEEHYDDLPLPNRRSIWIHTEKPKKNKKKIDEISDAVPSLIFRVI